MILNVHTVLLHLSMLNMLPWQLGKCLQLPLLCFVVCFSQVNYTRRRTILRRSVFIPICAGAAPAWCFDMKQSRFYIVWCFLIIFTLAFFSGSYAEEMTISKYVTIAWEHLLEHTKFSEELLSKYTVKSDQYTDLWYDMETNVSSKLEIIRIVFARASEYEELPKVLFTVLINKNNGDVLNCTCSQYSKEDVKNEGIFFDTAKENWAKSYLWEEKFGPHELWNVELNAKFCENWPYVPFQRYGDIETEYSLPPDLSQIQPDEAERIAKDTLKNAIYLDGISAATATEDKWIPIPPDDPNEYVNSLLWGGCYRYVPIDFIREMNKKYGTEISIFDYEFHCYEKRENYYTVFLDKPAFIVYVNSYSGEVEIEKGASYFGVRK